MVDGGQFGSARDRSGREGGVDQLGPAQAGTEAALDGADEVDEAGVGLHPTERGHPHRAEPADPTEVVADEVHDHHVLGLVLGGEAVGRGRRALDGRGPDPVALAAEELLGGGGGHREVRARHPDHGRVGRGVAGGQRGPERGDVTAGARARDVRGRQPAGQVDLVDVAPADGLPDVAHAGLEGSLVQRRGPLVGPGAPPALAGPGHRRAHRGEAGADGSAVEGHDHGPEALAVEGRQVVGEVDEVGGQAVTDHRQSSLGTDRRAPSGGYGATGADASGLAERPGSLEPMAGRRARARRTWPQRLLITFNVGVIAACLVAAGALGYLNQKLEQMPAHRLRRPRSSPPSPRTPASPRTTSWSAPTARRASTRTTPGPTAARTSASSRTRSCCCGSIPTRPRPSSCPSPATSG